MNAVYLAFVTAANLGLFLAFQLLVIAVMGAGAESDAFFIGFTLPQLVSSILIGAMVNVLMPIFARARVAEVMVGMIIRKFFWWSVAASLIISLAAPWLTIVLFPGLGDSAAALAARALQIQSIAVPFMMANAITFAFEYSRHQNIKVEIATLLGSVVSITIAFFWLPTWGIWAASMAVVIRHVVPTVLLNVPTLLMRQRDSSEVIPSELWHSLRPLVISSAYYKSEILLDRFLSSFAAPGMISLFNLAQQINLAGSHVFNKAFANRMSVKMVQTSGADVLPRRRKMVIKHLMLAAAVYAGWMLMILLSERYILRLLEDIANLAPDSARNLFDLAILLGGTLIGGMLGQVLAAQFYITQNTRLLAKIGVICFTLGAVAKLAGFVIGGIYGLAIATSLYYLFNCAAMAAVLIFWRRLGLR